MMAMVGLLIHDELDVFWNLMYFVTSQYEVSFSVFCVFRTKDVFCELNSRDIYNGNVMGLSAALCLSGRMHVFLQLLAPIRASFFWPHA
jgi:hypothetical protein